jgi:Ribosomal protein TL5, C-terminal domain
VRTLGKRVRRDLRKTRDRYVAKLVHVSLRRIITWLITRYICFVLRELTSLALAILPIVSTQFSRFSARRIPGVLQGRGEFPDVFLDIPLAPIRRAQQAGLLTLARKGKVKFTGPAFTLRFSEEDPLPAPLSAVRAVPCNILVHHLTGQPVSAGFVSAPPARALRVRVPVRTVNAEKCPGLRAGGWINKLHRAVDVAVAPGVVPPLYATVDVSGMNMKDRKPVSALVYSNKGQGCRTVLPADTLAAVISKV